MQEGGEPRCGVRVLCGGGGGRDACQGEGEEEQAGQGAHNEEKETSAETPHHHRLWTQ